MDATGPADSPVVMTTVRVLAPFVLTFALFLALTSARMFYGLLS